MITQTKRTARQRKPRGQGHERRAEILAAAKQMFLTEGFETVTTRKLADRVGLSQTGLYVYFQNKEEIFEALTREIFERLVQQFREVAAKTELGEPLLRRLCEAYIDFGLAHPDEYQLAFMVGQAPLKHHYKDLAGPLEEQPVGLQAFMVFHELMTRMQAAGFLRHPLDLMAASQSTWAATHGVIALLIARSEFPWVERRQLVATLIDTIVAGLLSRSRAP